MKELSNLFSIEYNHTLHDLEFIKGRILSKDLKIATPIDLSQMTIILGGENTPKAALALVIWVI